MNKKELKECIISLNGLIGFEYNGKYGNIESYYRPETKTIDYLLYFDHEELSVQTIDEVLSTKFFEGKNILEIAEELKNIDL